MTTQKKLEKINATLQKIARRRALLNAYEARVQRRRIALQAALTRAGTPEEQTKRAAREASAAAKKTAMHRQKATLNAEAARFAALLGVKRPFVRWTGERGACTKVGKRLHIHLDGPQRGLICVSKAQHHLIDNRTWVYTLTLLLPRSISNLELSSAIETCLGPAEAALYLATAMKGGLTDEDILGS